MNTVPLRHVLLRLVAVAGLAASALVALPGERADAAPVPCTRTYSSGTINERIPDGGAAASDIDVPEDSLVVADVDLTVNIRHPEPEDLEARALSYPDGQDREREWSFLYVAGNARGPGADMLDTAFDDDADGLITTGQAPFRGRFAPLTRLSVMNGFSGGEYRLVVFDRVVGNEGTLVSWSVTLTFTDCDADGDGVLTFTDNCPTVTGRTVSGCPAAARTLTASYRKGKFRGALASPVADCKSGRVVTVFRKRPGSDRRIGMARTRADGSWSLARAKRKGQFYATSTFVSAPRVAECPAVETRSFRIR